MINAHPIKFIYFDVGGVVIKDFSKTDKWNEMLTDLKIPQELLQDFNELFNQHEKKICTGESISLFVKAAEQQWGIKFPDNYSMTQDFVSRFQENTSILKLLTKLSNDFRLGLLTDQYPDMLNMIFQRNLIPKVIEWDTIIDSSIEGIKKPDPKIYKLAELRAGVPSGSILFVDNKEELLRIPEQMGWQTFEYDPSNEFQSTQALENLIYSNY